VNLITITYNARLFNHELLVRQLKNNI